MIESITICVNYSDYLRITLENNLKFFDKCCIVTDHRDEKTRNLCKQFGDKVSCLATDAFYANNAPFAKGNGINSGFNYIKPKGWIALWDADTLIDDNFNEFVQSLETLDKRYIYGPKNRWNVQECVLGSNFHHGGKACSGFLQIFHYEALKNIPYEHWHSNSSRNCSEDDISFSKKFLGVKYVDIKSFHIGAPGCVNWNGRKSRENNLSLDEIKEICHKTIYVP